jgi:hypothetical protein
MKKFQGPDSGSRLSSRQTEVKRCLLKGRHWQPDITSKNVGKSIKGPFGTIQREIKGTASPEFFAWDGQIYRWIPQPKLKDAQNCSRSRTGRIWTFFPFYRVWNFHHQFRLFRIWVRPLKSYTYF